MKPRKNLQNPNWRKHKSLSHRYLSHRGKKTQENVVMYHHCDISKSKQMSSVGLSDSSTPFIWK
jgi:aspartyl-tRNA synthetase